MLTAGELAVVERQKQASPPVQFRLAVYSQRKRAPVQPRKTHENSQQVPQLAEELETAIRHGRDIRNKANAQKVEIMDDAILVFQAQHVARS
jgi:hypothetical protein